jgi:hypothetical protein
MKILGYSLFLFILPLLLIIVSLIIFIPFIVDRYKALQKETKGKLREEKSKIDNLSEHGKKPLSIEERQAFCKRIHNILKDFKKKSRKAIDEDLGTEDLKKGSKELREELETKDIRELFK